MELTFSVQKVIPASREKVFQEVVDPEKITRNYVGFWPVVPSISKIVYETKGPPAANKVRDVFLSDGSKIRERILVLEPMARQRYEIIELNRAQKLFCRSMFGDWTFVEEGPKATRIRWEGQVRFPVWLAPMAWLAALSLRVAVKKCMKKIKESLASQQHIPL